MFKKKKKKSGHCICNIFGLKSLLLSERHFIWQDTMSFELITDDVVALVVCTKEN